VSEDPADPNNLPLTTEEKAEVKMRFLAANKRPAADFFEIFQEVTEKKVFDYVQGRSDSEVIMERLRARRAIYKKVKAEFVAISLQYEEGFKIEGLEVDLHGNGSAPNGKIVLKLINRKDSAKFSGDAAQVAIDFILFWWSFKKSIIPMEARNMTAESLLVGPSGHASNVLQFPNRKEPEPPPAETVL
jgi:hypothetical protein